MKGHVKLILSALTAAQLYATYYVIIMSPWVTDAQFTYTLWFPYFMTTIAITAFREMYIDIASNGDVIFKWVSVAYWFDRLCAALVDGCYKLAKVIDKIIGDDV